MTGILNRCVRGAALCFALLAGTAIANTAMAEADANVTATFYEFLEERFEAELQRSPIALMQEGRRERLDEWDDFSDQSTFEQRDISTAELAEMRARFPFDQLTRPAQISYRIFEYQAETRIANAAYYRHGYPVSQMFLFPLGVNSMLGRLHPVTTNEEAEAYVTRLEGLEGLFGQIAWNITDRTEFGVIPPSFLYPQVIEGLEGMLAVSTEETVEQHPLYMAFVGKLDAAEFGDEDKAQLLTVTRNAITGPVARGYQAIIDAAAAAAPLATTDDGVWRHPDGDEYYAHMVRFMTNSDVTPEEVHQFGLAEVERIEGQMQSIMDEVDFEGSLSEFRTFLMTDPQFDYPNTDEGREQFLSEARAATQRVMDAAPAYFNRLPQAGLEVRRVEPFREASAPRAFYNRPTPDGATPGIFWANLQNMDVWSTFDMETLVFHEAAPGHHFQIALQQEMEGMPSFQSNYFSFAYVEGWGLYAERLAHEMGLFSSPYTEFGRLNAELWRAVRLVLDTGIHYRHWDEAQAIEYMTAHTTMGDDVALSEVRRYMTTPGQALSYKMGMTEILNLRTRAQEALGDDFDIRDFHDVVVGNGAMPMPVLEEVVNDYITANLAE